MKFSVTRPFSRQATTLSRHRFVIASLAIGLCSLAFCRFIYVKTESEMAAALQTHRRDYHHRSTLARHEVETAFRHIYQNLRTISKLPSVRAIDRHASNLSRNDEITIQEIYNNLASNAHVSEVYILPEDFNPDRIDPVTQKPEEPIIAFDALIVGRTAEDFATQRNEKIAAPEEEEIHEYRLMREQIDWLKAQYPTMDGHAGLDIPAVGGREVITCDNSRYSPATPNDADRSGTVYSVPFYDMQGRLKGMISAVFLTQVLRNLMPDGHYALINTKHKQRILANNPSQTLTSSEEWIKRETANPNLLYSEVTPLAINDGAGEWQLWVGVPDSLFDVNQNTLSIIESRNWAYAAALLFASFSIGGLHLLRRDHAQTERKLIEEKQAFAMELANQMAAINKVQAVIEFNLDGTIIAANHIFLTIMEYTLPEIQGRHHRIFVESEYAQSKEYARFWEDLRQGRYQASEYKRLSKSGKTVWIQATYNPILNEHGKPYKVVKFATDITKRKEIEEKLQESEQRFQFAVTGSNNGIWDCNQITGEMYFSPRFKELLGYADHEMRNVFEEWSERLHPEDKEPVLELLQAHLVEHKGTYDVEYRLKVKSGEYKWFRAKGRAVWNEHGKPVRIAGSLSDISQRKAAEFDLRQANAELERLREESDIMNVELTLANEQAQIERLKANEATRLKSEFLANMSHEIRTPMNGVLGMINLLLDTGLSDIQRGYARTALNSAEALLQIINDILDFSKIEAGKIDLETIAFDFQLLTEEVCEMLSLKASEKGIELLLRFLDSPRFCIGDPGRIRQILFNLIGNAIKFTSNGHVMLTVQSAPMQNGKLKYHVEVEDTGIGIPAEKADLIFQKFSQADQSTARKFGGTGLGLSICKELVRMMDGDIGVRSTHGVGSTFWFEIVLEEDKSDTGGFTVPQDGALKGVRILVVDDNEAARTIIREQLLAYEAEVMEASSGKEALTMLDGGTRFDIAIIDFMMPQMNGAELGKCIKENPATAGIALLMVTSAPARGDKEKMETIGFAGYFSKPLAHAHLRDALSVIADTGRSGKKIPMVTQHSLKEARAGAKVKLNENLRFTDARVLLVEDNPVNRMVATAMLEKYGCKVTPAGDGDEAVNQLKQRNFNLVFMDCQMPVMDGYEATGIIRQMEAHQKRTRTPIIAFTANAMKGDSEKCLAAGMDDYIPKPVRQSDMERTLMRWLAEEKRTGGMAEAEIPPARENTEDVLDMAIFGAFAELMGENLSMILARHLDVAEGYIKTILAAADTGDYKAVSSAAHPLKSSSQQIGAMQIAAIAKAIEQLANTTSPDAAQLKALAKEAVEAQAQMAQALARHMQDKAA